MRPRDCRSSRTARRRVVGWYMCSDCDPSEPNAGRRCPRWMIACECGDTPSEGGHMQHPFFFEETYRLEQMLLDAQNLQRTRWLEREPRRDRPRLVSGLRRRL